MGEGFYSVQNHSRKPDGFMLAAIIWWGETLNFESDNHDNSCENAIPTNHHPGRAGGLFFDFCSGRHRCHADFRLAGVGGRARVGQETGSGLPLCLLGGLGRISSIGAQVDPAVGVQEGFAALANLDKTPLHAGSSAGASEGILKMCGAFGSEKAKPPLLKGN